jgi:hypothetical protein
MLSVKLLSTKKSTVTHRAYGLSERRPAEFERRHWHKNSKKKTILDVQIKYIL